MHIMRVVNIGFVCFRTRTDDHVACGIEPETAPNLRAELSASRRTLSRKISVSNAKVFSVFSSLAAARLTRETLSAALRIASPSL